MLGLIAVPTRAIEAWIALSVLWLAWELIRKEVPGKSSWAHLVLIGAFGLLHGSGFALSMEQRGFPEDALLSTLLLFNLGIEIGQLWIVTLLATTFAFLEKTHLPTWSRLPRRSPWLAHPQPRPPHPSQRRNRPRSPGPTPRSPSWLPRPRPRCRRPPRPGPG